MLISFFDANRIVHKVFVPPGQTVNQQFYLEVLKDYAIVYGKNDKKCGAAAIGSSTTMPLPTQPWVCSSFWQKTTWQLSIIVPIKKKIMNGRFNRFVSSLNTVLRTPREMFTHYVCIDLLPCDTYERMLYCTHHSNMGTHEYVNFYDLKFCSLKWSSSYTHHSKIGVRQYVRLNDLPCHPWEWMSYRTHQSNIGSHHFVNVYAL